MNDNAISQLENVVIGGDLSKLSQADKLMYYTKVCESVGLNPLTKPFEYISLNGKLTLYARRDATDQLRTIHSVSVVEMVDSEREGVYIVTVKVTNKEGRTDMAKGAVNIANLKGDALANAMMKAETKAKRRATLSICGLGLLDETEVETIPRAEIIQSPKVEISNEIKNQVHEQVTSCLEQGDGPGIKQIFEEFDTDQKAVLWVLFNSQQRRAIKELLKD